MAISKQLKLLFTSGSLIAAALASPVQKPLSSDDDIDDTPLPLVIWHGKYDRYIYTPWFQQPFASNHFTLQA